MFLCDVYGLRGFLSRRDALRCALNAEGKVAA